MKISVAIPTRERAEFLRASLATCVAIDDPDLEIVVCDNASADNTVDIIQSFSDPRIRLIRQPERVSQRLNFERAARESTGDYVLMMGDDDGMLSSSYPLMRHILKTERPPILSVPAIYYRWPSPYDPSAGRLKFKKSNLFGKIQSISGQEQKRAIETGQWSRKDYTPKIYHGFVSRGVLDRLVEKTGFVFCSAHVDVYFAAAALTVVDQYLHLDHPASILAMGPRSGGLSVQGQYGAAGDVNKTAAIIIDEAARDPIEDPIRGRMPALTMYLLTGIEQARRHAWGPQDELAYEPYLARIFRDLEKMPAAARQLGIDQLTSMFTDMSRTHLAEQCQKERQRIVHSPDLAPSPKTPWLDNYVTSKKVALDLRRYAGGNVLAAAQAADYLLKDTPVDIQDANALWRKVLLRASKILGAQLVGSRPQWGYVHPDPQSAPQLWKSS